MKRKLLNRLSVRFIFLPFLSGLILCSLFSNTKEITISSGPIENVTAGTPVGIRIVREGDLVLQPMPDERHLGDCQKGDDSASWILYLKGQDDRKVGGP